MSVSLPTHILSDLGEGCLVLKDANIDTDEGFLISRFLHTKEVSITIYLRCKIIN